MSMCTMMQCLLTVIVLPQTTFWSSAEANMRLQQSDRDGSSGLFRSYGLFSTKLSLVPVVSSTAALQRNTVQETRRANLALKRL